MVETGLLFLEDFMQKLISIKQLSQNLSVNRSTIYRWISSGYLPKPIKLGSRVLFNESDIDNFIQERHQHS